jgi:hypothetical protein
MGKKKHRSKKDLMKRLQGHQNQYNIHQKKVNDNPNSLSIEPWKKEKVNFEKRIKYYASKIQIPTKKENDTK